MDTFISGIIDYVARPSTTDSPVRVVRKSKSASESPTSVSALDADVGLESTEIEGTESLCATGSEVESSPRTYLACPTSVHADSLNLLSHFKVPDVMHNNSVLTAEGIISCGDFNACYDVSGDDIAAKSSESIETSVMRQFESAFATFLYKNPAFSSMSYMTLQKLRTKLLKESAKNIKVENELRKQLSELRHSKLERELELQRELVVVARAKATREAELQNLIEKTRRASMMMDSVILANGKTTSSPTESSGDSSSPSLPPAIVRSLSFEALTKEMHKNKIEQAHILADMERIKMKIAEDSVNGAYGCLSDLDPME
ncbi:hypothetical protein ACHAXA_008605 [Cyclostephanos tholiformis]|uniref:Uncharacterized protein n=1 Tax=Cyclostephanos tholiformis TaxID=382380 RepID=A0ABD3RR52_9STRA